MLFFALFGSLPLLAQSAAQQSPAPPASNTVALVDGQAITAQELEPLAEAQVRQLRNQEYEVRRRALDDLVTQKVLDAAARKRGLTADQLLKAEVDGKFTPPTDAEVEAFYLGQRDRLNRPFEDVKSQLRQRLTQYRLQQARRDYLGKLRQQADVTILLRPPTVEVAVDPARVLGSPAAPITIVEFSDFQCPFCKRASATIKEVMAKYAGKVRLAYRDFPLREIHSDAESAAEAARCAGEQGKFWEYHDLLFESQGKLDAASLDGYAQSLKLDGKKFQACLASGKFKAQIEQDLHDGARAGVDGTPGFFVNGVFLNGAVPLSSFERVIDEQLASLKAAKAAGAGQR